MIEIDKYRPQVEKICRELSLRSLDLVGSASRSDFSEESDVDVLVTFEGDSHLFRRYFDLKERLEALFGRTVDVVEDRALRNPFVARSLRKNRIRIYGA